MATTKETPVEESTVTRAHFAPADNKHLSFFCEIPKGQLGAWIKEHNGAYNPGKKAYVFLMTELAAVEKAVGFKPGESGLHDPKQYFSVTLSGEILSVEGLEALEKKLEPLGIKWSKQKRSFQGRFDKASELTALAALMPPK